MHISTKQTSVTRVIGFEAVKAFVDQMGFTDENKPELDVRVVDAHKQVVVYEITFTTQNEFEVKLPSEEK